MADNSKLSNKQLMLISYLLTPSSIEKACKKARIGRATFYAWLKDEKFKTELKRQRDKVVNEALEVLKTAVTKAVNELIKLMDSRKDTVKRWACKDILDYVLKSRELQDLDERLTKIEQTMSERRN